MRSFLSERFVDFVAQRFHLDSGSSGLIDSGAQFLGRVTARVPPFQIEIWRGAGLHGLEFLVRYHASKCRCRGHERHDSVPSSSICREAAGQLNLDFGSSQRIACCQPDMSEFGVHDCAVNFWSEPQQRAWRDAHQGVRIVAVQSLQAQQFTGRIRQPATAAFTEHKVYSRPHITRAIACTAAGGEPP